MRQVWMNEMNTRDAMEQNVSECADDVLKEYVEKEMSWMRWIQWEVINAKNPIPHEMPQPNYNFWFLFDTINQRSDHLKIFS